MAARELLVGPGIGYPFQTGARIFAALAFPGIAESDQLKDAETAYIADRLHGQNVVDGSTLQFDDLDLNDIYVSTTYKWALQKLRTTRRRIDDRQVAAKAVRPWVRELVGLGPHPPVPGIRKFNQRQISLLLCDGDEERAQRFLKRVWWPSRPILHLAAAIDEALSYDPSPPKRFGIPLDALEAFHFVVTRAGELQTGMVGDQRFGIDPAKQLTLRWVT